VKEKNGNFLLNLAPDKNGIIDINEEKILKEFGKLKNKKN
jgi:alpha-L-fucosidase